MKNYEILRECKIIHEYINDILTNGEQKLNDLEYKNINDTLDIIGKIYSKTYENIKAKEPEEIETKCNCPHCNNKINISDLIDYAYVCDECDENFYLGEGDIGFEWYFEEYDPVKFKSDFDLQLSFDVQEGNVIIGTPESSGARYNCKTTKDLRDAVESYACNYLDIEEENEYSIEIWETEYDRDKGEGFYYLETFNSLKDAIVEARRLYDDNNYACIEVVDENHSALYNRDNVSEDFYIGYKRISKVEREIVSQYVENWTEHKKQTVDASRLYCEDNGIYVAIDDTSGDCFVEEFNTEKQAFNWLLDLEEEKEESDEIYR